MNRIVPVFAFELRGGNGVQDYRVLIRQSVTMTVGEWRLGGSARKERGKSQSEDQKNMLMLHKIVNCELKMNEF